MQCFSSKQICKCGKVFLEIGRYFQQKCASESSPESPYQPIGAGVPTGKKAFSIGMLTSQELWRIDKHFFVY